MLWLDTAEKFVVKDSSNNVTTILDRISGVPIIQSTKALQPVWTPNAINSTLAGINFASGQYLSCDSKCNLFAGLKSFTIFVVCSTPNAVSGASVVSFTDNTTDGSVGPFIGLTPRGFQSKATILRDCNPNNDVNQTVSSVVDGYLHLYTCKFDVGVGNTFNLDGVPVVATVNNKGGENTVVNPTCNSMTIGATKLTSVTGWIGTLASVIMYMGTNTGDVEHHLLRHFGLGT